MKEIGLKITVEPSGTQTDFLDLDLNIKTGTFKANSKPNTEIKYVHVDSNHPPQYHKKYPKRYIN